MSGKLEILLHKIIFYICVSTVAGITDKCMDKSKGDDMLCSPGNSLSKLIIN